MRAELFQILADLLHRNHHDEEMVQELTFHMQSRAADLEQLGLSPAEAKRRARVEFGGLEGYKERCREQFGFHLVDELRADVRYAFRVMRKNIGFTATAVVSLALGISVNLSCFAALSSMVLHPFSYADLSRIMTLAQTRVSSRAEREAVSPANYLDWKQQSGSFQNIGAFRNWDVNLTGVDQPDHIHAALASSEFFRVLSISPFLGRTFTAAECEPGHDAVVVVSSGFWQSHFASAPDVIGRTVSLGGRKYTVIGVMPGELNLPLESALWAPLAFTDSDKTERTLQQLTVIGKLRPGIPQAQAAAEMEAIARRLEKQYPRANERGRILVTSLRDTMTTESGRFLSVLMCAALFVLLLACTNVGSLQVARAMSRKKEMGLRSSLGASSFRIVRQLLTESVLVGLTSGLIGLAFAAWNLNIMRSNIPPMVYRIVAGVNNMRMNSEVAAYGFALSLAASMLCCVPAILQVFRSGTGKDLNRVLNEGGRGSVGSPARARVRTVLVVAEVALAFILLVGAGLMVRTLQRIMTLNLGYDPANVLTAEITLSGREYEKGPRVKNFYDGLLQNFAQTNKIEAAAAAAELGPAEAIAVEGRAASRPEEGRPEVYAATSQYLRVMRIPLLKGRWISEQDDSDTRLVTVVNASVAHHYWPNSNPIGEHLKLGGIDSPWLTVVGVVGDTRDWFLGNPMARAYVSFRQSPQASGILLVRGHRDSGTLTGALRAAAATMDREQPIYDIRTLQEQMYEETSGVRSASNMMSTYAVIALLLAVTGIYSISSFFVTQRTREIGVRVSLGASRLVILRMVLRQSCTMTGIGLLIGVPVGVLLSIGMSHALYNVVAVEPGTFVLILAVLGSAGLVAGYIPSHRAARLDPTVALRHE